MFLDSRAFVIAIVSVWLGLQFMPVVFADSRVCSKEEAQEAESVAATATSWRQLYQQYKLYAHCDDGAIAEGFSEAVTRLLSGRWRDIRELKAILEDDRRFREFVFRHIDETVPADRLDSIARNAAKRCPRNMKSLCSDIASAAASAKKAM